MKVRRFHKLAFVALALAIVSCRGCGEEGPATLRDLAAPEASLLFEIPDVARLADHLDAFSSRATRKAGASAVARTREGFKKQFNFDPLDPNAYGTVGVDPKSGLLLFTEGDSPEPLLAVVVTDGARFDGALKALASKLDGADKLQEEKVGSHTVTIAGRPFGGEVVPALVWTRYGRYGIATRPDGRASLDALLGRLDGMMKQPKEQRASIDGDATYKELTGKLPAGGDLVLFVRPKAAGFLTLGTAADLSRGAAMSFSFTSEGFASDTFVSLAVPGLTEALHGAAPRELGERVESDAVFVALSQNARADAVKAMRAVPAASKLIDRALEPLATEVGLNPETEVLPLLAGPLTLSVHVADLAGLPAAMQRNRSLSSLLDFVHVVITAKVNDSKAFLAVLERSQAVLEKRGVTLDKRAQTFGQKSATVFFSRPRSVRGAPPPTPRLGWAVIDDWYVYAAGPGRLERVLSSFGDSAKAVGPALDGGAAKALLAEAGGNVVVLRAGALANAAGGIQLGNGTALGVGAMVGGALDLLRTVGDIGISLTAEQGGLRLKAREALQ